MNPGDQSIFDAANDQHERIMNQSNTPRTDERHRLNMKTNVHDEYGALLDHARQLETELADANKRADNLLKALHQCLAATGHEAGDIDDFRALQNREQITVKCVQDLLQENTQLADEVYQLSHKIASQQTLAKLGQMEGKL